MYRYTVYIATLIWFSSLFYLTQGDKTQFYVSSERLGCELVDSIQPCPATVLSPDLAIDYETDATMANFTLDDARKMNASDECISALTTSICSSITPQCYLNGSKDFSDARAACVKANETCPEDAFDRMICKSLKVGRYPLSPCVKPTKPINGTCPQPKFKVRRC